MNVLLKRAYRRAETAQAPGRSNLSGSRHGETLSKRERGIVAMIGEGLSNTLIARTLQISPETVKSHVKRIFAKLSVSTGSEAVCRAGSLGLL